MTRDRRLIVVSNRLPITLAKTPAGFVAQRSAGGLVSALLPIIGQNGGWWVGWTGTECESPAAYHGAVRQALAACSPEIPAGSLVPLFLTENEKQCFYRGCSNEIIWPLFHDLTSRCVFNPAYWSTYCEVNDKFAAAVATVSHPNDVVWVHDYHLMMLAEALVRRELRLRLAYFHHIPFPSPDIFEKLPWRKEILRGLLQFHTLGFQTKRDRNNFLDCVRRGLGEVKQAELGSKVLVQAEGRSAFVGAYPISIDFKQFAAEAAHSSVALAARTIQQCHGGTDLILGVDRLDYTKGIVERLQAFELLLRTHPELRGRVSLAQITVPSREDIPEYQRLKSSIEEAVARINAIYGTGDWVPVDHIYGSVSRRELLAWYRAASVALVTPLNDGMNLVAKEFCASRVDECGSVVLSEFAGAAQELGQGALLVNPYDSEGIVAAILQGLRMSVGEQRRRMKVMRARVQDHDVFHWADSIFGYGQSFAKVPLRPSVTPVTAEAYAGASA
ncbi:MAG TPA: trehalose-6-phosphate synthase [Terriglobales bacterium]|nr:trehalose-6-phosphate synthase [Terriglobales bacterium]